MKLENLEYMGGGYFRDKSIPKGEKSYVIHAPELLKDLIMVIDRLNLDLWVYGHHLRDCESHFAHMSCTCGYDEALELEFE